MPSKQAPATAAPTPFPQPPHAHTRAPLPRSSVFHPAFPPTENAGNRPSTSILLPDITPFTVGQLLALYENRVAVQVGASAEYSFHGIEYAGTGRRRRRGAEGGGWKTAACCGRNIPSAWGNLHCAIAALTQQRGSPGRESCAPQAASVGGWGKLSMGAAVHG